LNCTTKSRNWIAPIAISTINFKSTQIAIIFLDKDLVIRSFTPAIAKLFNLIPGDRGRPLTDIAGRIVYPDLENDIRAVFGGRTHAVDQISGAAVG
jgi:two-component system CheB/CheR fusion protein